MNVQVWLQNQLTTDDMPAKASGFLAMYPKFRFLSFTSPGGQQHLVLSVGGYRNQSHASIVNKLSSMEPTWTFVSGGYVEPPSVYFDSETCRKHFGFDSPNEEPEQTALLVSINEALRTHGILQ